MTSTIDPSPEAAIAKRIAEGLGWERVDSDRTGAIYGRGPVTTGVDCIWALQYAIHLYGPGEVGHTFGFHLDFHTPTIHAFPAWPDRHRWTEEGREFVRRVNALTDGLVVFALTNAGQTACLDWLRHDPT